MTRERHTFTEPQPPRWWSTVNTRPASRFTVAGASAGMWFDDRIDLPPPPPYEGRYAGPRDKRGRLIPSPAPPPPPTE